jgi:hypothetical protein
LLLPSGLWKRALRARILLDPLAAELQALYGDRFRARLPDPSNIGVIMRAAIVTGIVLATLGCSAAATARQQPAPILTSADSAAITAAFLAGDRADSARYVTLRQFFARRDSVEAAAKADPRRYMRLVVF